MRITNPEDQNGKALMIDKSWERLSKPLANRIAGNGIIRLTNEDVDDGNISNWILTNASIDGMLYFPKVLWERDESENIVAMLVQFYEEGETPILGTPLLVLERFNTMSIIREVEKDYDVELAQLMNQKAGVDAFQTLAEDMALSDEKYSLAVCKDFNAVIEKDSDFTGRTEIDQHFYLTSLESSEGFYEGEPQATKLAVESWTTDIPSLKDGSGMFINGSLNIFVGELTNIETAESMFSDCASLERFASDMPKLVNGVNLFYNCTRLKTIRFSKPIESGNLQAENMFYNTLLSYKSLENICTNFPVQDNETTLEIYYDSTDAENTAENLNALKTRFQDKNWTISFTPCEH